MTENNVPLNNHLPANVVTLSRAPRYLENLHLLAMEKLTLTSYNITDFHRREKRVLKTLKLLWAPWLVPLLALEIYWKSSKHRNTSLDPAFPKTITTQDAEEQFVVLPLFVLHQDKHNLSSTESKELMHACNQTRCSLTWSFFCRLDQAGFFRLLQVCVAVLTRHTERWAVQAVPLTIIALVRRHVWEGNEVDCSSVVSCSHVPPRTTWEEIPVVPQLALCSV